MKISNNKDTFTENVNIDYMSTVDIYVQRSYR